MSSKPYCTSKAFNNFKLVQKRPSRFICVICGSADDNFVMDHKATLEHTREPGHKQRAQEKEDIEWDAWNAGAQAWKQAVEQEWGGRVDVPPELSLARWLPDDEIDWEEAEAEKKVWISKWIDEVEGARLQTKRKSNQKRPRQ
jgi:hypothetical protein